MTRFCSWLIAVVLSISSMVYAGQAPTIDKDELKALLGSENLVVLDVRRSGDWNTSEYKIKGAIRVEDGDLSMVRQFPKDNTFVLYCA